MRTLSALVLALATLTSIADAKPRHARKPRTDTRWMRDCIHERTGPVGGVSQREARTICTAEQPDDEVAAAKAQLSLARINAKVAKAKARAAKAIEACEQAVVDRCVEAAKPDGSTDCQDETLRAEFNLVCLAQEGK